MISWNRRRWAAAAAVAATGAAAVYYVYDRWGKLQEARASLQELEARDGKAPSSIEPATVAPASPLISETEPTSAATIQQDADRHLVTHFESVQAISTTTTTPSLLPMLLQSLTRNTDHKPLLELLRQGGMAADEKYAAWEEIKVLTFTRAVAASWMVSLLDLMNRVQLNILGRHLYLQSNILDARHPQHSGLGSREQPLQMTQRAQELFLAYAHYCGERGVEPLIPIVKQAVTDAVSNIELTTKLGADQVLQMFSDAHKRVAPELSRLGFEVFLLPSPEHRQVWHSAARFPDNGALQPGALGGLDDDAIDGLLTEVRQIIGSAKFGVALKAAVQESARVAANELHNEMKGEEKPLAKLCPRVAELANKLLQRDDNECVSRFANLPEIQRLSATVYSCGPVL